MLRLSVRISLLVIGIGWFSPTALWAFSLKEIDRFTARLPWNLGYSTGTCSLWISGNTQHVYRTTLTGRRVERVEFDMWKVAFSFFHEGRMFGVSRLGQVQILRPNARTEVKMLGIRDAGVNDVLGGDVRRDGTIMAVTSGNAAVTVFSGTFPVMTFGEFPDGHLYRDLSFDRGTGWTFALLRKGSSDRVVVFDETNRLVATHPLDEFGVAAEGIAVQPETGDLFVSFIERGSIGGEIVRFAVDGLFTEDQFKERPAYECSIS